MCLINFQLKDHPNYKLIIAANRDEFYKRPTKEAHFWEDDPEILAGRDLKQMGTWLGITKHGRFAALTNFRDPEKTTPEQLSRGSIVKQYLAEDISSEDFLQSLKRNKENYAGFNVIFGNPDELFHYNNILNEAQKIHQGTHGLSNHTLNTPWPKVKKGKKNLREYVMSRKEVHPDRLFEIVSDAEEANDEELPQTGVGLEFERKLSPLFIKTPEYGTRSSTVLLVDNNDNVTFIERTYSNGEFADENKFTFKIS
ncbi:NRDE family protein [Virgibacillus doumboii]|uniref:NRDE family protein n=1 Tax=Virgibacillus doumboii TaxID=2697503 RepID=UPI0013DFF37C|nr:NRDE family protein [Virgibacillus doumboii]